MLPILQVRDLCFHYDACKPALDGISLDIAADERIAVLGPNGAGKSTFFLCLNGVLAPDSGKIILHGREINRKERKQLCEHVGVVFQNADDQIIAPTVASEVSFGPMNLRLERDEVARRVEYALDYMDLQTYRARPPHDLSGGEKKRVSIADLLAMESEILLLDEPAASLDPAGSERLEQVLGRLSDEGRTLVISTHDMDFALRWATRVVVLVAGKIIADGLPQAVLSDDAVLRSAQLRRPMLMDVWRTLCAHGLLSVDTPCPASVQALARLLDDAAPDA